MAYGETPQTMNPRAGFPPPSPPTSTYSSPSDSNTGVLAYLRKMMEKLQVDTRGMGGTGGGSPDAMAMMPSPPKAVPSPEGGGPINPTGMTKQNMGQNPASSGDSPPGSADIDPFHLYPNRRPDSPLPPGGIPGRFPQEQSRPSLMFAKQGESLHEYDPSAGIENYVGPNYTPDGGVTGQRFMDTQATPGGGAFSGSSTPVTGRTPGPAGVPTYDWSGVANPMAFEAYTDPIKAYALEAERVKAEKAALDPMWEERERAGIWKSTQLDIQSEVQRRLEDKYKADMAYFIAHDLQSGLSDEAKAKAVKDKSDELLRMIYGEKGMASMVDPSPSGYTVRQ